MLSVRIFMSRCITSGCGSLPGFYLQKCSKLALFTSQIFFYPPAKCTNAVCAHLTVQNQRALTALAFVEDLSRARNAQWRKKKMPKALAFSPLGPRSFRFATIWSSKDYFRWIEKSSQTCYIDELVYFTVRLWRGAPSWLAIRNIDPEAAQDTVQFCWINQEVMGRDSLHFAFSPVCELRSNLSEAQQRSCYFIRQRERERERMDLKL